MDEKQPPLAFISTTIVIYYESVVGTVRTTLCFYLGIHTRGLIVVGKNINK